MIRVLADKNIYKTDTYLPQNCSLHPFDPDEGFPLKELESADAMLVRTVTSINAMTLAGPPNKLRFIGTASSGSDHLDTSFLKKNNISWADAKGCNARAVAEYISTVLLLWEQEREQKYEGKIGIIGVGNTGGAVNKLLQKLGYKTVLYDPPRAELEDDFESATAEELLSCGILSFHVPLTREEPYRTYHWLDEEILHANSYELIINASRGGVVDEKALLSAFNRGIVKSYVLDVWENEPDFNEEISKRAFLATPHIAGYSDQAKQNATRMICKTMADHFNLNITQPSISDNKKMVNLADIDYDLKSLIARINPILEYNAALRDLADRPDKTTSFNGLRTKWPFRQEYQHINIDSEVLNRFEELRKLGVSGG